MKFFLIKRMYLNKNKNNKNNKKGGNVAIVNDDNLNNKFNNLNMNGGSIIYRNKNKNKIKLNI